MLKSVFCVDLTAFVYVAFEHNYVKAKKQGPTLSATTLSRVSMRWVTVRGSTFFVFDQAIQANSAWPSLLG